MLLEHIRENQLWIGDYPAVSIVEEYGSPLYVYDAERIESNYQRLVDSLPYQNKRIHYAVKANSNLKILKLLEKQGAYVDTVSVNEVILAQYAGFSSERILFTGINLKEVEMEWLVSQNIRLNIGSLHTLEVYGQNHPGTDISIRVNPDMGAGHHSHVITGGRESKFGIFENQLDEAEKIISRYELNLKGIHAHIGSGILDVNQYIELMIIIINIAEKYPDIEFVDFGGGIGIPYREDEKEFDLQTFGEKASARMTKLSEKHQTDIALALEPGRFIVGDAGYLLTTVTDIKKTSDYTFVGVDTGFNHLVRPMAYSSYHQILNASGVEGEKEPVVIAGYLCESGDLLTKNEEGPENRILPHCEIGDILAVKDAGAYGFSMSMQYNAQLRPAEVMIRGSEIRHIRRRETIEDLVRTQL